MQKLFGRPVISHYASCKSFASPADLHIVSERMSMACLLRRHVLQSRHEAARPRTLALIGSAAIGDSRTDSLNVAVLARPSPHLGFNLDDEGSRLLTCVSLFIVERKARSFPGLHTHTAKIPNRRRVLDLKSLLHQHSPDRPGFNRPPPRSRPIILAIFSASPSIRSQERSGRSHIGTPAYLPCRHPRAGRL